MNLELRAGTARADALRNLANRTQMDDLTSLVTMLVQTDKFGTSVAQSLRVHSDTSARSAASAPRKRRPRRVPRWSFRLCSASFPQSGW